MKAKPWTMWRFGGVVFLAVPRGVGVEVTIGDERGRYYGAWRDVASFRDRQRKGSTIVGPLVGTTFQLHMRCAYK